MTSAHHPWGRVDADGTVYVRTADGERVIGSWEAGSPEEALAFFQRKYESLETEVVLLEQRLSATDLAPAQAAATVQRLIRTISEANALGDLDGLRTRLERLTEDVGHRREEVKAAREQARVQARDIKERIVTEAEEIAAEATHWKSSGERMRELLEEWKTAPHAERAAEAALWKRLSAARNAFTKRRKAYFATLEAEREDVRVRKEQLVTEAEDLCGSTDWGPTTSAFRELMRLWKAAGRADRDAEAELWKRFRAAQDKFFTARADVFSAKDAALRDHATAKQELVEQAQGLLPVTDFRAARSALRGIQERWEQIGAVPRDARDQLESSLRRVEEAVRKAEENHWRRSNPEALARAEGTVAQLRSAIAQLEQQMAKARDSGDARAARNAEEALSARRSWLVEAENPLAEFTREGVVPEAEYAQRRRPGSEFRAARGIVTQRRAGVAHSEEELAAARRLGGTEIAPIGEPRLPESIPGPPGSGKFANEGGSDGDPSKRYLRGQYPQVIPVGKPFSLLISIVLVSGPASTQLKPFNVPREGLDVLLVAYAPDLRLLSDQRQCVHVPPGADSEPVMFELRADTSGPRPVSITAWLDGNYLGELVIEITAERDVPSSTHREALAEMTTEAVEGAVSLVVRYDKTQNAYRFEFRDEDNPAEVISNLAYDPGPLVEQLIAGLDSLAMGRTGHNSEQARNYLLQRGASLWRDLVPEPLRAQFWDRQDRIRQLTILADKDAVPWELLYPRDPGHDAGFLVDQFPVTRAVFGRRLPRKLSLWPARFVLAGSLPEARREIESVRQLLDPGQSPDKIVSALTPLQDLIEGGNFGLLHFACHNRFDPLDGSSITLDNVPFTPYDLTGAAIDQVLAASAPTVFMNACRSAGFSATYNRLDGWAIKFLEAGAAAFIGSLWAVSDGAAREFAQELYHRLQAGLSLGVAMMQARQTAASQLGDPTWLAYTVYGDPRATVSRRP